MELARKPDRVQMDSLTDSEHSILLYIHDRLCNAKIYPPTGATIARNVDTLHSPYVILPRMERKGLLSSTRDVLHTHRWRRRYYAITQLGIDSLRLPQ